MAKTHVKQGDEVVVLSGKERVSAAKSWNFARRKTERLWKVL